MASTTKEMLALKKAAAEEKEKGVGNNGTDSKVGSKEGEGISQPDGGVPNLAPVDKPIATESDIQGAQEVAMASGATEIPTGENAAGESGVHAILKQNETPTAAEVQTRRTEVDTHVTILPSTPTGANVHAADPPRGTLPNDGMILQDTGIMGSQEDALAKGLALNRISDEENEKAVKQWEGEQRRQRMLEGRPRDTDLQEDQNATEPPEGGYKSNGILRFVDAVGNWVNAVNGYFVPQNDDEKKILDHYVKTGVVEAPAGVKAEKK